MVRAVRSRLCASVPSSQPVDEPRSTTMRGQRIRGIMRFIRSAAAVEHPGTQGDLPSLWLCPRCGARLVSRNLWHSCVQVTLEELFASSEPSVLELARTYVSMLHSLGDVQVIPQRTRLVCVARVRFAGLSPRKDGFLASFSLHRWLDSPRIVKTADYGPRWRSHYVLVQSQADLDDELMTWLQEAHDVVGMQSGLRTE
jgi:Domain of unknown function (DUF5655)